MICSLLLSTRSIGYGQVFYKMVYKQNKLLLGLADEFAPVSVWHLEERPVESDTGRNSVNFVFLGFRHREMQLLINYV